MALGVCFFKNRKNKKLYFVLHVCPDATNDREGQEAVVYCDEEGNVWVREWAEFFGKFEPYLPKRKDPFLKALAETKKSLRK